VIRTIFAVIALIALACGAWLHLHDAEPMAETCGIVAFVAALLAAVVPQPPGRATRNDADGAANERDR